MKLSRNTGLVLEGGGMRCAFTCGVLDAMMKHECRFTYVVAVSAGACHGISYVSQQPRRARISAIDLLQRYGYIGLKHFIRQGSIFDPQLLYDRFPNELVPFDYDAFFASGVEYEVVTTNCLTGRAEYLSEHSGNGLRLNTLCRASSSLPYVSPIIDVDGVPMLDGGIVDSIPVQHSIERGHALNVCVLTRNRGYRSAEPDIKVPRLFYKQYPRLRVALSHRVEAYNQQLDMIERMEDWGEVLVIRPQQPLQVDRICRDVQKLEQLYEEGFSEGEKFCVEWGSGTAG